VKRRDPLRKVVVTMFMWLEGVLEEPAWTAPYGNDEIAKFRETLARAPGRGEERVSVEDLLK
jgi:hypothetical protein